MNKRHTEYLDRKFRGFFKHRKDLKQSLMGFGYECGDGWYLIIKKLMIDIEKELNLPENKELKKAFEVVQVKEKFGELRFYIGPGTEKIFNLIGKAENDSRKVCGNCGHKSEEDVYSTWGKGKKVVERLHGDIKGVKITTTLYKGGEGPVICPECGYKRIY